MLPGCDLPGRFAAGPTLEAIVSARMPERASGANGLDEVTLGAPILTSRSTGKQRIRYYLLAAPGCHADARGSSRDSHSSGDDTTGRKSRGRVDCRQLEPQTVPYCMRAQSGVALVKSIAWDNVNINMDTPSSPPRSVLGPEDARFPPASQTYSLHCVLPFRWLDYFHLSLLYYRLPAFCASYLKVSLPSERFALWHPETAAMTVPDYEIPRDVVPPGNQTGTYYIPISNVCETFRGC